MADGDIEEWTNLGPHRFLENAPIAIVVLHVDGRIAWANQAIVTMFGYARPEIVGRDVSILIPDDRRANHANFIAAWVKHPRARPMGADLYIQGRNKNGDLLDLDIQLSPLETNSGIMALAWIAMR